MNKRYLFRAMMFTVIVSFISLFFSPAFSAPQDHGGLVLWLDGSDVNGDGTNPANGALISQWTDKSGVANHATAAVGQQPIYSAAAINGSGAVDCSLDDDDRLSTSISSSFAITEGTILVVTNGAEDFAHVALSDGVDPDPREHELLIYDKTIYHHTETSIFSLLSHQAQPEDFYMQTAVFGSGPLDLQNYINGAQSTGSVITINTPLPYQSVNRAAYICDRAEQQFDENFNGKIAEILVYSRKLSLSEQVDIQSYLSTKYDLPHYNPTAVIEWSGDRSGSVPTAETARTEQATLEAFNAIFPSFAGQALCGLAQSYSCSMPIPQCILVGSGFYPVVGQDGSWLFYTDNCGTIGGSGTWGVVNATIIPKWGDINDDGDVNAVDVLLATQDATGLATLSLVQRSRGNVAPLVGGIPNPADPHERLNAADMLLITQKALGIRFF